MYRRTSARIISVSKDLKEIKIKLPLNYKNRNYVGTIFGGSMFAAVDPIPMVQLINLLSDNYIVWDKEAQIQFKRPGKETLYATFTVTQEEIEYIKNQVEEHKEIQIVKTTELTDYNKQMVFCSIHKTIYIADKTFYRNKVLSKRRKTKG